MIRIITIGKPFFTFQDSRSSGLAKSFSRRSLGRSPLVIKTLLLLLAVLFSTPAVWAETVSETAYDESSSPWYLGARLGYTYKHHSCVDIAIECDRGDAGYGIFSGYKMGKHFGLELSASDLGETKATYPNVSLDGEMRTLDLSVTYTRNLYKKINAFGKLGVAYWDGKITGWENVLTDSGERPTLGAGIQFPFTDYLDGRIEYQYLDQLGNHWMGYTDAHFLSFSLVWKFSSTKTTTATASAISERLTLQKNSSPQILTNGSNSRAISARVSKNIVHQHVESTLSDFIARP